MFDTMNIIDLLAVLPFWLELLFTKAGYTFQFLRSFRLLRIFRIFKLARTSAHVRVVAKVMYNSVDALLMLCIVLAIGVFVFASLILYAERGTFQSEAGCFVRKGEARCSPFQNILVCSYWVATTMTTVGYGDVTPSTASGRFIAVLAMIAGILVIVMPVSILCAHFVEIYTAEKNDQRLQAIQLHHREKAVTRDEGKTSKMEELLAKLHTTRGTLQGVLPDLRAVLRGHSHHRWEATIAARLCEIVETKVAAELASLCDILELCLEEAQGEGSRW